MALKHFCCEELEVPRYVRQKRATHSPCFPVISHVETQGTEQQTRDKPLEIVRHNCSPDANSPKSPAAHVYQRRRPPQPMYVSASDSSTSGPFGKLASTSIDIAFGICHISWTARKHVCYRGARGVGFQCHHAHSPAAATGPGPIRLVMHGWPADHGATGYDDVQSALAKTAQVRMYVCMYVCMTPMLHWATGLHDRELLGIV
jgi:hypothetical protein